MAAAVTAAAAVAQDGADHRAATGTAKAMAALVRPSRAMTL
jgi:hypothetical protein